MLKKDDNADNAIKYFFLNQNGRMRILDITKRARFNIFWAALLLRPYMKQTTATIRTDHYAVKGILDFMNATDRPARWRLCPLEPVFDEVHRAGIK